ncbi:hypothetical protein Daus18300_011041 [Diaporthe australafricana]|uniref:Phosphodiester glycosidase domain-containing protein n=1 Tax=Diaporthe australafricana TaxID=127596 RepID=A0ABR3W813_9PEZI
MKATNLLTIMTCFVGLGQAVPLLRDLMATNTGLAVRASPPPFKRVEISPGSAQSYHFYSSQGWQLDKAIKDNNKAQAVLGTMGPNGLFTVVKMCGAKTYCVGAPTGKTRLPEFVISDSSQDCIYTSGGFFITGRDKKLRAEHDGPIIADVPSLMHFSVGQTSVTQNFIKSPKAHDQFYRTLEGDAGSFIQCAPGLEEPLSEQAKELQYWATDSNGDKITNPVHVEENKDPAKEPAEYRVGRAVTWCDNSKSWRSTEPAKKGMNGAVGSEKFVRTVFSHIPGGVTTANEPNERLATVVLAGDIKVVFAYTCARKNGVTINGMREVINVFLKQYLDSDLSQAKLAVNLDGGASIFVGWMRNERLTILAAGGLGGKQSEVPHGLNKTKKFRSVTTMVKHVLNEPIVSEANPKNLLQYLKLSINVRYSNHGVI